MSSGARRLEPTCTSLGNLRKCMAMKLISFIKWRWTCAFAFAIVATFVVCLEPTRVLLGWLRGDAFYGGRPTRFWHAELARYECWFDPAAGNVRCGYCSPVLVRLPTLFERVLLGKKRNECCLARLPILSGAPDTIPVLEELTRWPLTENQQDLIASALTEARRRSEGRPMFDGETSVSGGVISGKHTQRSQIVDYGN